MRLLLLDKGEGGAMGPKALAGRARVRVRVRVGGRLVDACKIHA
jgi:hypothetical protein